MRRLVHWSALVVASAAFLASILPAFAAAPPPMFIGRNAGFYDHQVIEYQQAAVATAQDPEAAKQISKGLVVYHMVDSTGNVPAVQCARLTATFPNDMTSCNVLNSIPTDKGYTGGSWNLQIFHWNPGQTPVELSKDDDILAAVANGLGTLEVTNLLVRCPVANFSALR
jgi:hypothetical protein